MKGSLGLVHCGVEGVCGIQSPASAEWPILALPLPYIPQALCLLEWEQCCWWWQWNSLSHLDRSSAFQVLTELAPVLHPLPHTHPLQRTTASGKWNDPPSSLKLLTSACLHCLSVGLSCHLQNYPFSPLYRCLYQHLIATKYESSLESMMLCSWRFQPHCPVKSSEWVGSTSTLLICTWKSSLVCY